MKKRYYFDYAATTPVLPQVIDSMLPFFNDSFNNPSGNYEPAEHVSKEIEKARNIAANFIGAKPSEIFFTSGGTESDNWALRGVMLANEKKGRHLITSQVEHHAILNTCKFLTMHGYEVTYLPVENNGIVSPVTLKNAIRDDTVLVSIMFANNEIGTVQPIKELSRITHMNGSYFHTDAVQAFAHLPVNVNEYGIDLLSASSHKCYGPKGVGLLYKRESVNIHPLMYGGSQEMNLRAGTYHVPGIIGFGEAIKIASETLTRRYNRELSIRNYIIYRLRHEIPYVRINGDRYKRLPNNINVCFDYIEGESLLILLDACGIDVSTGSACNSKTAEPSHVLMAIGLGEDEAKGTIRITIGNDTTRSDADYLIAMIKENVSKLRMYSPEYLKTRGDN